MSRRRAVALIGALLLAMSAFSPAATAEQAAIPESVKDSWLANHSDVGVSFERQVDYQRHFRSQFDFLDSSDSAIAAVMALSPSNNSFAMWGLQLTDSEHAELIRRQAIAREFPAVAAAVVGDDWSEELVEGLDPEGSFGAFAGHWIDQDNGGRLVLALRADHPDFAAALGRAEATVDSLVGQGKLQATDVIVSQVQFGADDLYRVNSDFANQYLHARRGGEPVGMSASMNPVENRVDLWAEQSMLREAEVFAARYPDGLVNIIPFDRDEMSLSLDTDPQDDWGAGNWHSGAHIAVRTGTGWIVGYCTWGATARTTSYVYVVTAAHCLGGGVTGTDYTDNTLGLVSFWNSSKAVGERRGINTYAGSDTIVSNSTAYVVAYHGTRGDIARLQITHAGNVDDHDCYLENGSLCGENVTGRELTTETLIGDLMCASLGGSNTFRCALLNSNDAFNEEGYDYVRSVDTTATNQSVTGDSGAGWLDNPKLSGIHFASWDGGSYDSLYTHAYYIEHASYLDAAAICGTSGVC